MKYLLSMLFFCISITPIFAQWSLSLGPSYSTGLEYSTATVSSYSAIRIPNSEQASAQHESVHIDLVSGFVASMYYRLPYDTQRRIVLGGDIQSFNNRTGDPLYVGVISAAAYIDIVKNHALGIGLNYSIPMVSTFSGIEISHGALGLGVMYQYFLNSWCAIHSHYSLNKLQLNNSGTSLPAYFRQIRISIELFL